MIIYIMGRGFSGSTILDIALSQSDYICGMGELVSGFRKKKICACGKFAANCEKWRGLHAGSLLVPTEELKYVRKQSNIFNFPKYFFCSNSTFKNRTKKYIHINKKILRARLENDSCKIVVDSSKEITRGLIHSRNEENVLLIHLIKNPTSVISSYLKRLNSGEGFRFLRKKYKGRVSRIITIIISAFGWILGNLLCELVKAKSKKKIITVRYEDLLKNQGEVIQQIESEIDSKLPKTSQFLRGESKASDLHQLGGNKTKYNQNLFFDKRKLVEEKKMLTKLEIFFLRPILCCQKKYYGYD